MKLGAVFPQTEIGTDLGATRDYAEAAEQLGYHHLLVYEHVLGAPRPADSTRPWPYDHRSAFLEPFVLFGYLAAVTVRLELVTAVLVLPQRQAVLVAKQAATADVLSGGRLRLGIGTGWNLLEYAALGADFHARGGKRVEEQIAVLRRLWTEELVELESPWHHLAGVGINPRPARPIPIWIGGRADVVLRRVARFADGWLAPQFGDPHDAAPQLARLDGHLADVGRSRADVGIEARIPYGDGDPVKWASQVGAWRDLGASHVCLNTMDLGWTPARHIGALEQFAAAVA